MQDSLYGVTKTIGLLHFGITRLIKVSLFAMRLQKSPYF